MSRLTFSAACVTVALAGCTTTVTKPVSLPLPARPTVPAINGSDLQCLAGPVYSQIVNRERGYKTWGLQLEAIIEANNAKAKQ